LAAASTLSRGIETLFFNVRDRLANTTYLLHHAIGHRVHTGIADADVAMLWKLVALAGGAHALDDVIQVLTPSVVADPTHLRKFYNTQNRDLVGRRSLLAGVTLRVRDPMFKIQLMELHAKYIQIEVQSEGPAGTEDDYLRDSVMDLLRSIPISANTGTGRASNVLPNGVELRVHDQINQACDLPLTLPEDAENVQFPTARPVHEDAGADDLPGESASAAAGGVDEL
jgi:hypothetical protein